MNKEPITLIGLKTLEQELHFLKNVQQVKILFDIKRAREFGDLKENAEYHAAKEELSIIQTKIKKIETYILNSIVIDVSNLKMRDQIVFGATVEFQNLDNLKILTYQIVGEYEANLENNKISVKSPLANALISKKKNDIVSIRVNSKIIEYKIIDIKYV